MPASTASAVKGAIAARCRPTRPRVERGGAVGYLETVNLARRSVLGLLGGLAAAPLLTRRAGAVPALPEISLAPHRRPEPGLVEIDLDARPADVMVDHQHAAIWTYGGSFPGKLLRVGEGETVRLRFANRLTEVTNLHFHGLHVPPTSRADNSWLHVPPGETFAYEFEVPRGSAGTYWYHPHAHGTLARQLWAGLSGPLVVDGPLERMPELAGADERIVLLRDLALDEHGWPTSHRVMDWHEGKQGDLILANGAVQPVVRARAGTVRLRLINASNARYFRLALAAGQPLHLIATDGHYLETPVAVPEVLLVPGERADVLIQAEDARPLALRDLPYDRRTSHHSMARTVLTILPRHDAAPVALPTSLANVPDLRPGNALAPRRVTMAMFFVNGRLFDPGRIDGRARLGDLEHWQVENVGTMDHPFHLHTWHFQVVARNGRPEPFRAWRDMLNLKPGDRVDLLVPLVNYPGRTLYHCHISEHGDKGMMAVLEVERA
jgi:FtsP/CotA-like multicopper oxidase with cupredoxin domain